MFERIGETLAGMVQIPTVSGSGDETMYQIKKYHDYLRGQFGTLFGRAESIPVGDALLLQLHGSVSEAAPVLFTGHMDVVPAFASGAWEHPPFSGCIENGCLWGRGSQDMKGPQCALLSAVDTLLSQGWEPGRDVWFYLSCDEETGGDTTKKAAQLLQSKGIHFETVFDEGGTICENFMDLVPGRAAMFGIAEKGSLVYHFTAHGRGGHAANPAKGSAIARLAAFICRIEENDPFRRELSKGSRQMLKAIAAVCDEDKRYRLQFAAQERQAGYPILHEVCPEADNMLGATIAFAMIEGGSAHNVMPKEAILTANVRVSSVETEAEVTAKLKALASEYDLVCELSGGSDATPESSTESVGYQAMKKSVEEVYPGLPVIPFVLGGGTDSRHFQHLADQVLRFSPMYATPQQGAGVHGDNESVFVQAVADAARCYYVLFRKHI